MNINLPETLSFGLRGHTITVATDDATDMELIAYLVYGAQRFYNDKIGSQEWAGNGYKANTPERIKQVSDWFSEVREAVASGVSGRKGPRNRKPVEPVAAAREAILDERVSAYIAANQTALFKMHNVPNITAFRKEKLDAVYREKILAKYAAEIETEAKARAAKLAKAVVADAQVEGDTLAV